jgi:hypothetical protein
VKAKSHQTTTFHTFTAEKRVKVADLTCGKSYGRFDITFFIIGAHTVSPAEEIIHMKQSTDIWVGVGESH